MLDKQIKTIDDLLKLPVDVQFHVATKLAANCGYQLVAEDTERSLEIKDLISRALLIEGLEALLK